MNVNWIFAVTLFLTLSSVTAETIDPLKSDDQYGEKITEMRQLSSWPVARIRQLNELHAKLNHDATLLPHHCPIMSDHHLGYHSSLNQDTNQELGNLHHIDFTFDSAYFIRSIALAPAFNPLAAQGGSYAFPTRFKIEAEVLKKDISEKKEGQTEILVLVDWMNNDFSNPGAYPVFFNHLDKKIKNLRLSIPKHSSSYFALGEVFIWADDDEQNVKGNLIRKGKVKISASDSYTQLSRWDQHYLIDTKTSLGFPIGEETTSHKDLLIIPQKNDALLAEDIEITVDLGRKVPVERIEIWPAKTSGDVILPDFGFPGHIDVDTSENDAFDKIQPIELHSNGNEFGTLFSVNVHDHKVRYVRLRIKDLQKITGQRILGIGEIAIHDSHGKLVRGASVSSAQGIPKSYDHQLSRLVDGHSWGRLILSEYDWIKGLAKRRPVDQQLKQITDELALAHSYWDWLLSRIIIAGMIILFIVIIVGVLLFQRYQRQSLLIKQGERINRDLHDEVGSSLGSISLLADELAHSRSQTGAEPDLNDLSLMAREANASLREVVWNPKGEATALESVLNSFLERAERVLRGVQLETNMPDTFPKTKVSIGVTRHLSNFFKELVHNCARHANAKTLYVAVAFDRGFIKITVKDDGCGFSSSQLDQGWGLKNLHARAKEISGELTINSQPGNGVLVTLKVPIDKLSKEPRHVYQTSN